MLVLDIDELAPRRARRWVEAELGDVPRDVRERVVLVTSELVTNVLRHGGERAAVRLSRNGPCVRLEVTDSHPGSVVRQPAPASSVSGRGLLIVEALAERWGVTRSPGEGTKTVWCEVALSPASASSSGRR